jgi:hypothetical protein
MGLQAEACHWGNLVGLWSVGLACLKGASCGVEIMVCVDHRPGSPWGPAWCSPDCAGLCRPEGHIAAEIMNACGSLAWQALGGQSGGDRVCLIGGSLGECGPGGIEE